MANKNFKARIGIEAPLIAADTGATAITLVPITSNNPNADFTGNIVKGAIRSSTFENAGDIWQVSGPSAQSTGISVDNTDKVADRTALVLRNYGASVPGAAPRSAVVFEAARGSAASPLNLNSGNVLGELFGNGYTSTGWASDVANTVPILVRMVTTEAWNNGASNAGSGFTVLTTPTATALSATNLQTTISANPQTFATRSDSYTWAKGKTNTSSMASLNDDGTGKIALTVTQPRATTSSNFAVVNFITSRSTDGTNYTPTQSGDIIGQFKFNGNANTSTSPGVPSGPGGQIQATATELWSSTANGTKVDFFAIKTGTISSYNVISAAPDEIKLNATTLDLNSFDGSTALIGNNINYNRVYGAFQYNTTVTPVAANTAYVFPIGTTDFSNIVTVASTSRIIIGAAGIYNLQFSVQVANGDNQEHTAYVWLRKNGSDVTASMGRITVIKSGSLIAGWNYYIDSANTTDYYEIAYAVSNTAVTFPTYAATAFGPSTASLITTISPVGA